MRPACFRKQEVAENKVYQMLRQAHHAVFFPSPSFAPSLHRSFASVVAGLLRSSGCLSSAPAASAWRLAWLDAWIASSSLAVFFFPPAAAAAAAGRAARPGCLAQPRLETHLRVGRGSHCIPTVRHQVCGSNLGYRTTRELVMSRDESETTKPFRLLLLPYVLTAVQSKRHTPYWSPTAGSGPQLAAPRPSRRSRSQASGPAAG
jgi:hypothetical protein